MANSNSQGNQNAASQPTVASGSAKSHKMLFIAGIVVLIAVLGLLLLFAIGSGTASATTTVLPQSNSTPIYMSASAAQGLLGSQIINYTSNYSAASLYNSSSPNNITTLESLLPILYGNVTNGWVTTAFGSGPNNASMQYYVLQTSNSSKIAPVFAQDIASSFISLPKISYGSYDGLNYTYEDYSNSSGSFQNLIGWKSGYVVLAQIFANAAPSNQTQIAQAASSPLP